MDRGTVSLNHQMVILKRCTQKLCAPKSLPILKSPGGKSYSNARKMGYNMDNGAVCIDMNKYRGETNVRIFGNLD